MASRISAKTSLLRLVILGGLLALIRLAAPGELPAQERLVRLDTLRVQVGSRVSPLLPALTRSVQALGREEIEALPVRTVSGLLSWATSVEVQSRSPAQGDLGIRGAGFEQVVVLVNGVRVSDPQTGHFDLDLAVPLDRVERVEILRGPASALYGADAMGGVVNIVTRGDTDSFEARVEGGSWGAARISAGGGVQENGWPTLSVGGEFSRSDGHRPGTDHETALLHATLSQELGEGRVSGEFGIARRDFGAEDFYAPYPSFEKTRSYTSAVRWSSGGTRGLTVETGAAFRRHEDEFTLIRDNPQVYQNRHTSSQVGGDVLVRGGKAGPLDLALGGDLNRDLLQSNSLGDRGENRASIFGEAVLAGEGKGVLSLGLRQDWHEGFGSFLSPSVSGSLRIGSLLRTRAAVGRSFRAPSWTERYYQDPVNVGRSDLEAERAWSGEVGVDLGVGRRFNLAVTAFIRRSEDLIDWARPTDGSSETPWETRNVEEATFRGVEGDLSLIGPGDVRWSFGAMLLSVDSNEVRGFVSKYALRPLEQQLKLGVGKQLRPGLKVDLNLQRALRGGEDPHYLLGFRGGVALGSTWVYLDANNLLGSDYLDITGAKAPGRALYLGLRFRSK